jgi:hypothetical protein
MNLGRWSGQSLLLLLWGLLGAGQLPAQAIGWAADTLPGRSGDTLRLSHSFLVPFSDTLSVLAGGTLAPDDYVLDPDRGWLLVQRPLPPGRNLLLRYRYFRQALPEKVQRRDLARMRDTTREIIPVDMVDPSQQNRTRILWEESSGLRKSGSLSTGINAGSNRGPSLTSGLRLQLEGDLGDGLQIVGALTDENLPVQPDGTTQQISDFDKVFIKLSQEPYAVTLGDYEISRKHTRFTNFYRNVQGMQVERNTARSQLRVSGAVAKGQFHTNSFMGVDGVSGPYRLQGKNGEQFFIVLAGSERVYLNGKLMERGEANDYVINYNTAELTFTAQHVITNIARIVVDFEYSEQNFNRSLVVGEWNQTALNGRLKTELAYARDADNPNAPFSDADLYNLVRDSLANVGDSSGAVLTSGVFNVGYEEDQPRYEQRDTLVAGQRYVFYRRSTNPELATYRVLFSRVGQGRGLYERDDSDNEFVYRWVGPDASGRPQGEYAPVRRWVLPRLLQVLSGTTTFQVSEGLQLYNETALSSLDENRLSELDDADNQDLATRTGFRWQDIALGDSLRLQVDGFHQYVGERYTNLDRVYQAEYNRVWNLRQANERRDEQIGQGGVELQWLRGLSLRAEAGMRHTGPGRQDFRQMYRFRSSLPRYLRGEFTYTRIDNRRDSLAQRTRWDRYEGDLYVPLGHWQLGSTVWIEDQATRQRDSLVEGAFRFVDVKPYLRTVGWDNFSLETSLNYRIDRAFQQGSWRGKTEAYTAFLRVMARPLPSLNLQNTSSFRSLNLLDSVFAEEGLRDSRVITTNFQSSFNPRRRVVSGNLVYEVSSEQLARQELRFIQVPAGQGTHVWLDSLFNDDGIQDIEEFQIATNPLVADFIRVLVPTTDLVPTTRLGLSGNVRIGFRKVIADSAGFWGTLLRETQAATNFRIAQSRSRDASLGSYFIDLVDPLGDTSLLNASYTLRQDLLLFQSSRLGSINLTYSDNQVQLYLSSGNERRGQQFYGARGRLSLGGNQRSSRSLELSFRMGEKFLTAENFANRNYDIAFGDLEPEINLQLGRSLRLSGGYAYLWRNNRDSSEQVNARNQQHKLIFTSRWNISGYNNLNARLELVYMTEEGETDFAAQYELRQGLTPGGNAVWQLLSTFRLLQDVELSVIYDGRSSGALPVVHTGRVQVRAFF